MFPDEKQAKRAYGAELDEQVKQYTCESGVTATLEGFKAVSTCAL